MFNLRAAGHKFLLSAMKRPAAATLILRLPPRPELCAIARERILAFARPRGIEQPDVAAIVTAVGEALANAVEHAGTTQPIEIEVQAAPDRLVAIVRDAGVGFESPAHAVEFPDAEAERGRGLAIMRRTSDIFSVAALPGGGTEVTIGRYLRRDKRERHLSA